jgi:2-iminobutanoate/2-iminopropanoate deaminase
LKIKEEIMENEEIAGQKNMGQSPSKHIVHDIGIANQVGSYSDGVEVAPGARWLYTSGMLGMSPNGNVPDDIKEQSELVWRNLIKLLESANMSIYNIVKVTQYLTRTEDIAEYSKIRRLYLADLKPASTLLITPQLGRPDMLVEVEVIAAKWEIKQ